MTTTYTFTTTFAVPVAILAQDLFHTVTGAVINLDGTPSFDPGGSALTYNWKVLTAPIGSGIALGTDTSLAALNPERSKMSLIPDKLGSYTVQLTVNNSANTSAPAVATIHINLTRVPCGDGMVPDASFLWDFISDFWKLVEDRTYFEAIWSAVMQVQGAELVKLWANDYNKSLRNIQDIVQRRWVPFSMVTPLEEEKQHLIVGNTATGTQGATGKIAGAVDDETTIFHVPLTEFDFTTIDVDYGARGRILLINGAVATIERVFNDGLRSVAVVMSDNPLLDVFQDTAKAGAASTVTLGDDTADEDDEWEGWTVTITGGTGAGQAREVTVYDAVTQIATVDTAWATIPDTTSTYDLHRASVDWRLPHLLHTPGFNLVDDGVHKGDVLVLYVARGDSGTSAELRAQVVAVQDERLGFEFSLEDLTSTDSLVTPRIPTDHTLFHSLISDLKILSPTATATEIAAAAEAFISFIPTGINLSTRPFTAHQFRISAERIIHNSIASPTEGVAPGDLGDIVCVPHLQAELKADPAKIWKENTDYILDTPASDTDLTRNALHFEVGVFTLKAPSPEDVWAECAFVDNSPAIEGNFGILAGIKKEDLVAKTTRTSYISAVKGLWYAYTNGPTIDNIKLGVHILMGLPFSEERGEIISITPSFTTDSFGTTLSRVILEDVDEKNKRLGFRRIYYFPTTLGMEVNPLTDVVYAVGDYVEEFTRLCKGVEVKDYVNTPLWWTTVLSGNEILKFFIFRVTIDTETGVFNDKDLIFALEFLRKIKPTYVDVVAAALINAGTETIPVTDSITGSRFVLNFYDNVGPMGNLEATYRLDDFNHQGTMLLVGNRPFRTLTTGLLSDIRTFDSGAAVMAESLSEFGGVDQDIRTRNAGTGIRARREGDLLVLWPNQLGSPSNAWGLYEITATNGTTQIELGSHGRWADGGELDPQVPVRATFPYGTALKGCILRREINPITWGEDLVTNPANGNQASSVVGQFLRSAVGVGDMVVIETGPNAGDYLLTGLNASPDYVQQQTIRLVNLDGTVPIWTNQTGQTYRVIRPQLIWARPPYEAQVFNNGGAMELELLNPTYLTPYDVFSPFMVNTALANISNADNPIHDGQFLITSYIHSGRVGIAAPVTASDAAAQAQIRLSPIPGLGVFGSYESMADLAPLESFAAVIA
jgi:hypothetical protein